MKPFPLLLAAILYGIAAPAAQAEPGDICWSQYLDQPRAAIKDCSQVIDKGEWSNDAYKSTIYYLRGVAQLMDAMQRKTKKYDAAFDDLTESIEIETSPNRPRAHYFRGNIHLLRNNRSSAAREFKKALELMPDIEFRSDIELQLKKLGAS